MKQRWVLALTAAGTALALTACGDKSGGTAEPEKAAEAVKAEADKAAEAANEATAKADEAAKAAAAEADKAKAEAEAKAKEAAAAAEAAKPSAADIDAAVALMVDMECAKKRGDDAGVAEELLAASGMSGEAYKAALAAAGDAIAGAKERVAACPTADDIKRDKVVGMLVQLKCLREAKVDPAKFGQLQKDIQASFGLEGAEYAALRDSMKDDETFKAAVQEGMAACPEIAPEDLLTDEEVKARPKRAATAEAPASYKGKVFGAANGSLAFDVAGGKVSGKLSIGPNEYAISGYKTKSGQVVLKGSSGENSFRGLGRVGADGGKVSGNWNGTMGGKIRGGSFTVVQ